MLVYCDKASSRSRKVLLTNKKIIHLPLPILHEKLNRKMLYVRTPCFTLHMKRMRTSLLYRFCLSIS